MATLITEPASINPATIDWQALISKTTKVMGECMKFRLTNMTTDAEPQMETGSRFEVNGSFYECATAENITGWSGISNGYCYVYATPSGGSATFSYSSTAPTFSSAKGGWFNGTSRALFKIMKTGTTGWTAKRYVDLVEGMGGSWTDVLSMNLGADWSTALAQEAGAGVLAQLVAIGLCTSLNADLHDGYHAGNGTGQIPISNGVMNTNLHAVFAANAANATNATNAANAGTSSISEGLRYYQTGSAYPPGYYIVKMTDSAMFTLYSPSGGTVPAFGVYIKYGSL